MSALALADDASVCRRHDLTHLSDPELLSVTRRLVGASNQLLADLLVHLGEVEARGIHRAKACASLYTYCIYELRFSEDAAFRRVSAARWVRQFPRLFGAIASGELHLTGVLMLGPHLTPTNCHEVLARAKHRTKKELSKLVRELDPLPDVPARVTPLGPEPPQRGPVRNPTWAEYVASMVPVRHLTPGDRPRDWIDESTLTSALEQAEIVTANDAAPARVHDITSLTVDPASTAAPAQSTPPPALLQTVLTDDRTTKASDPARTTPTITGPQRYSVQFTASQTYVDLLARARALLSHSPEPASLEELHLRAMRLLVTQLEKEKYGARPMASRRGSERGDGELTIGSVGCTVSMSGAARNREAKGDRSSGSLSDDVARTEPVTERERTSSEHCRESPSNERGNIERTDEIQRTGETQRISKPSREIRRTVEPSSESPRPRIACKAPSNDSIPAALADGLGSRDERHGPSGATPCCRSRHVPARIRRRVFERDGARCTFVDDSGARCAELERLELHHLKPFASAGEHHADNLTLRCRAHNALAAERDFGRENVLVKRDAARHESLRSQRDRSG